MLNVGTRAAHRAAGVTLIELMVTLVLMSLLLGLAAPNLRTWMRNSQVRTVSDTLQNGMRLAQTEAVRRSRQVVFYLTNDPQCSSSTNATANGAYWAIRSIAQIAGEPTEMVQCGVLADVARGVAITGPTAVCFNSMGRQTASTTTGVSGATCTLAASGTSTFNINTTGADRPLRVLVTLGGQTRQCDPARTLSDAAPDGCP